MYRYPRILYGSLDAYPLQLIQENTNTIFPLHTSRKIYNNQVRCAVFLLRFLTHHCITVQLSDRCYRRCNHDIDVTKFTDLLSVVGDTDIDSYAEYLEKNVTSMCLVSTIMQVQESFRLQDLRATKQYISHDKAMNALGKFTDLSFQPKAVDVVDAAAALGTLLRASKCIQS